MALLAQLPHTWLPLLFTNENNRLISRINTNKTTAVAIRASLCKSVAYPISMTILEAVSYTHLDVYKRQRLSMVENSAYRLAVNIKKTQKRANALKNITIPKFEALTKSISNALEEKEREEFTRLKVIKKMQSE